MNRRTFMLGLGLLACSGQAKRNTTTPKRHPPDPVPPDVAHSSGVVDTAWLVAQLAASPLAFHGDVLIQSIDGELRAWDTTTMRRTDTWTLPHSHFCFVQDGTLVAVGFPPKATHTVIHRIANGKVTSKDGPILPSGSIVVLPASKADEIYVAVGDNIYLIGASREVEETLAHPYPNGATRDQWISRGDGQLVGGRSGALYVVAPKKPNAEYPIPKRELFHLSAGTGDLVWYSYADIDKNEDAHTVMLAKTITPMVQEHKIDTAPARVVHLASSGSALAVLMMTRGKGRDDTHWSVAVFDDTGKQRWRADVPDDFAIKPSLNNGFIALNDHRVVVAAPDGKLIAWNAADGSSIKSSW